MSSAKPPTTQTTNPFGGSVLRAEYPPALYWRKWAEDAAPAVFPVDGENAAPAVQMPSWVPQGVPKDSSESPYRVLIVEDDRSQALFAESVLNGIGMQAQVVLATSEMMQAMETFRPDLVLMDLHMPGMSGTELTSLIREHSEFAHIPVVFLTGEPDPEMQFEALESGADDFLSKPARPRHLVAAVMNRIKRARALHARPAAGDRNPATGLYPQTSVLQRLSSSLPHTSTGGVYLLEIENTPALRDRYGYSALESVLTDAGRQIASIATDGVPAARLNDNTFLLYPADIADHEAWARMLRDSLSRENFAIQGDPLRLGARVGYVSLEHGFADAATALSAAEQALRAARSLPAGYAAYEPPTAAEESKRTAFANELRGALTNNRFELAYQPIVAVAGGDDAQYQTLLRLRDESGGLHTAAAIIPIAEASGLMAEIDRRVMMLAIEMLRRRRSESKPVRLFVSQSPRTLISEEYAGWLVKTMAEDESEGGALVIDVRQNDAQIHAVALHEFCTAIAPTGVQLCLSQYQSSEESDVLLGQLPLGFVRLSAGNRLDSNEAREEMRSAIDRAHRLGLQVIGQQVQDPQAAAALWMSGVDFIQGNLVQGVSDDLNFDFNHSVL